MHPETKGNFFFLSVNNSFIWNESSMGDEDLMGLSDLILYESKRKGNRK